MGLKITLQHRVAYWWVPTECQMLAQPSSFTLPWLDLVPSLTMYDAIHLYDDRNRTYVMQLV